MRRSIPFLLAAFATAPVLAQNDIENVIVETYYVSDANDATDTIGGTLAEGSRTYRIHLDLGDSCTLRAIYGTADHPLTLSSTGLFFNNRDRGKGFGHEIANGALDENTVALDSWLSFGAASNQKSGVLKAEDTDGSILGGDDNDGGSAQVPGGLLVNAHPDAGIALTEQDGLVPLNGGSALPPSFNVAGDDPRSVFGDTTAYGSFITTDMRISCSSPGVAGPTADDRILIAQLTTTGELSFQLNIELERPDGTLVKYVATDTLLQGGETPSGLLTYPPQCGCTDPDYLEYDGTAGCDDGSCHTPIVFGCLDDAACNFDASANFNVPQLCCYGPDDCNGLDVDLVCPQLGITGPTMTGAVLEIFPNPAHDHLFVRPATHAAARTIVTLLDLSGRIVLTTELGTAQGDSPVTMPIDELPAGTYLVLAIDGRTRQVARLVKE